MEERKLTCIGCPMGCQLQVIISAGTGAYWRCDPGKCSGNRNRYNSYQKYRENFVKIEDCVLAESYVK